MIYQDSKFILNKSEIYNELMIDLRTRKFMKYLKQVIFSQMQHLHRVDVHAFQHLRVPITAYIQNDILPIASLKLVNDVKEEERFRDERPHRLASFPRHHMDERLTIGITMC